MKQIRIFRFVFSACGLAALVAGCHAPTPVLLDHPRMAAGVQMQDVSFYSAALGRQMTYRVFLPAAPAAGKKLDSIYLLHGNGGGYREWSNDSDVAGYAARGAVLVMPEGESSYFVNAALSPSDRYEDYLFRDVIADVESRFPVAADGKHRAIVGVSMGGFAAVKLALTHPEAFAFAGAISPAIDVPSRQFRWRRWSQGWRFRTLFGPAGSDTRKHADPFLLVQTVDPGRVPYLYVTAGQNEPLLEPNRRFAARLQTLHFAYEFHTRPGGHNWTEWDAQLPGCFESLFKHLQPAG